MQDTTVRPLESRVKFYDYGVTYTMPSHHIKGVGGVRGKIKGWSYASRRRMREWMIQHRPKSGYVLEGLTFTIPGPPVTPDEMTRLWKRYCETYITRKLKGGMVWRLELQKRKQPHWHCLVAVPHDKRGFAWALWFMALDILGPCEGFTKKGKPVSVKSRSDWPFASARAAHKSEETPDGRWLRYLQDHSTKRKQEQISDFPGHRHWGVVNRRVFEKAKPESIEMTRRQAVKVLRAMRKMMRPRIPLEKSELWPGYRLGYSPLRGSAGQSVWFMSDAMKSAVRRLVKHYDDGVSSLIAKVAESFSPHSLNQVSP